jgi:hypothetical protein
VECGYPAAKRIGENRKPVAKQIRTEKAKNLLKELI